MTTQLLSGDAIYEKLMAHIAPLPCQESYARDLASIFSMHLKRNALMDIGIPPESLPNNSAIIVAPSGQGKTFLFQQMAKLVDINTIVVDASALSREGWKGLSLSQQLLAAQKAVGNPHFFSRSILFFDEIDKLADAHSEAGNPQSNLLQLFNNGSIQCEEDKQKVETVDVSRFTVVMAGAFAGLDKIIEKRLKPQTRIGFGQSAGAPKWSKADLMKQVTSADLAQYGLMTELLGRAGTILVIDPMGVEDYRHLLSAEHGSIRQKYALLFDKLFGVSFDISEDAVEAIAEKCMSSETGARAINPLVDNLMRRAIWELEWDDTINGILLDGDCSVKFTHGKRACNGFFHSDAGADLPPYPLEASSIPNMAESLCDIFRASGGDENVLPELRSFLNCILLYLKEETPPEDFCYASLEKLVPTIQEVSQEEMSVFHMILTKAIRRSDCSKELANSYRTFQSVMTIRTPLRLLTALNQIRNYIQMERLGSEIQLKLTA